MGRLSKVYIDNEPDSRSPPIFIEHKHVQMRSSVGFTVQLTRTMISLSDLRLHPKLPRRRAPSQKLKKLVECIGVKLQTKESTKSVPLAKGKCWEYCTRRLVLSFINSFYNNEERKEKTEKNCGELRVERYHFYKHSGMHNLFIYFSVPLRDLLWFCRFIKTHICRSKQ